MSIFVKPKLKALKECLAAKDWEGVQKNANAVLDFESSNYNARVFLALALFNLGKAEESEETYKKAVELSPSQPLARQGLASFYEKQGRWTDYARELQGLMELFLESQDASKYAETLEKLLDVRRKHGTKEELIDTLSLLLTTSPSRSLLESLPAYNATTPNATNYGTVQQAVRSPLRVLLEVTTLVSGIETATIDAEIRKRRQRLGGPALTAEATTKQVQAELLPKSQLPGLWRQILDDPDAGSDEELRRDTERRLLAHLRTTLAALPSRFDPPNVDLSGGKASKQKSDADIDTEQANKDRYRSDIETLARGMCVIGVPEGMAWEVEIEWSDIYADADPADWPAECWAALEVFSTFFPNSGLAQIVVPYRQLLSAMARDSNLSQEEEEMDEQPERMPGPTPDEMAEIVERGLNQSPRSLVAHILASAFFRSQKEWDAVLQVTEAGIANLKTIEAEAGTALVRSRRFLDVGHALALAYCDPPTHHLRALRLIETLLAAPPPAPSHPSSPLAPHPDPSILIAKASVLQSSEGKQAAALRTWDEILTLPTETLRPEQHVYAQGERAWALHLAGQSADASIALEQAVDAYETRKATRDKEREAREKYRSRKGIEKPEGVEEGELEAERVERAQAWWRLGECHWAARRESTTDEAVQRAFDAYIAALRAWPSFAPAFTSLGVYYRSLAEPDWDRSSKCFQKAFELDPLQEVAARSLAEEFAQLSEWSLVEVIARRVVEGNKGRAGMGSKAASRLAWAWKAIGSSELSSKRYPAAITAFQAALRGEPDDVSTWIKLGLAYRQSGKHVAALKVFGKALTHDPTSWFAKYSIADVQRDLGLLEPAIETFKSLLADRPDELGVRVVLAETTLANGLTQVENGFTRRAEDSLLDAVSYALSVVEAGTATRVGWKVVSDALSALGKIADLARGDDFQEAMRAIITLLRSAGIDEKLPGVSAVSVTFLASAVDEMAPQAAAVAVAVGTSKIRVLLESQNDAAIGSAWFDLGVAISNFRMRLPRYSSPPVDADQSLQQAIRCLKYALYKEPLNATFWNALGVLAFDVSPRLAQHCFIRSVEYNSRSAVPWTNLGLFYLVQGDEDLANQSFLRAQVLDPDWTAAWIGQGTLADLAGHAAEASVLLEHAFSLAGSSPEADIAYATRAYERYCASVSVSGDAPSSAASSAAQTFSGPLFALSRYLSRHPDDYGALHLYALMLEKIGDLASAGAALERAASLIEALYETDESPLVESRYVIAQTNLGRVRLAAKDHAGALEAFDAALSLVDPSADEVEGGLTSTEATLLFAECRLGSSLAHIALGEVRTAIELLESTMEDVDPAGADACGDHIAVGLGRAHWAAGDEDHALSAFLDSPDMPQSRRTPMFLRRAFLAFAIATDDAALLEATRASAWDPAVKYDDGIARLLMLRNLAKGETSKISSAASRALHALPWAPTARTRIAQLLLSSIKLSADGDNDENLLADLGVVGRLVREQVDHIEDASTRTRRFRTRGIVALAELGVKQPREEGAETAESPLPWFEKAAFIAPWDPAAREAVQKVAACMQTAS